MDHLVPFLILNVSLQNSLQLFVTTHFGGKNFAVLSSNYQNLNDNLDSVLSLNNPKMIVSPETELGPPSLNQNYILLEDDFAALNISVTQMLYNVDPRGNILVILQKNVTEDELVVAFKTLWRYYIYNVVIFANWTQFVTWFPFDSCGKDVVLVTNITDFFADKIPKHLGCSIRVAWAIVEPACKSPFDENDTGFAVQALNTISEKLGLTVEYMKEPMNFHSFALKGENYLISVGTYLAREEIDMALSIIILSQETGRNLEVTKTLLYSPFLFAFPPRKKLSSGTKIVTIFTPMTWFLYLVTILVMSGLSMVFTKKSFGRCFFNSVQTALQSVLRRVPKEMIARLVFFAFLYCVTNLNWFYVSQMSSVLTRPSYEPQIKTLTDLLSSDKVLIYFPIFNQYLQRYKKETFEKIKAKNVWSPSTENLTMESFILQADYGLILWKPQTDPIFKRGEKLNIVTEDIAFMSEIVWSVRRGFPLIREYNFWATRIVESGLVEKLVQQDALTSKKYNFSHIQDEIGALNFNHLYLAFQILIGGLCVASVCFVVEIVCEKKKKLGC